ncbi:MAG: polysaccharide deacetylase family protein [Nanoarchaeota archaeon]|nr:polysaccharide deacetylase family protein [Nanoarchaeota archaeon]
MVFSLRIDLESDKGIREGVPKILALLKKYNIKASFYVAMGGESNILELLRYQKKLPGKRKISVFSRGEMLRMVFFPRDFVLGNKKIFQKILDEGHELGIHGWKHREWTRGLEKIDVRKVIRKAVEKYTKLFGKKPQSFCAPAFRTNNEVVRILSSQGIKVISDFEGDSTKKVDGLINVPITLRGEGNTPIIEYLVGEGYLDKEILDKVTSAIKRKKFSSLYIHGLFECRKKIGLLENLFKWLEKNKIKTKKIMDVVDL